MASYTHPPICATDELIQQHARHKASITCGLFVYCIATRAGLYTAKKQHRQLHIVDDRLNGRHSKDVIYIK